MIIDIKKCIGCKQCIPYCPTNAISIKEKKAVINQEKCTECGVCYRAEVCKVNAFYQEELEWPRAIRAQFSNPLFTHKSIEIEGRGTEEMKTNDVTYRFKENEVGIGIELGRPGVGTNFDDFEKITIALVKCGVNFATDNPSTHLIDIQTGKLLEKFEEIRWEFVISAIVECVVNIGKLKEVVKILKEVSKEIDTVFSLDLIFKDTKKYKIITDKINIQIRPNAKVNVGMASVV